MKYKTTDREQRAEKYIVVGFGYCSIQNITRFLDANAYTCGVYGWRADFYDFGNVGLSTGYTPLTFAYDKRAGKIGFLIKKGIEKLEKDIKSGKFKDCGGSWHKMKAKVEKKIQKIIDSAYSKVEKAENGTMAEK